MAQLRKLYIHLYTSIMQPCDCLILTIGIYRDEVFRGMLFHCRIQKTLRLINIAYDGIWPDSLCSLGNFDCHSSRDIEKFIHDLSRNWYHCCIVQSKCSQKLSFFAVCIFWKQVLALDKLITRYSEETLSPLCLGTSAKSSNNTISMGPDIDVNWKILWKQISFSHKYFDGRKKTQ